MLVFEVEFLTGRCVATDREERTRVEWPPHPARFFAALAAAHFERQDDEIEAESERAALQWLEKQQAVSISVPELETARTAVTVFVPVNDKPDATDKGKLFPKIGEGYELRRNRQPRTFPTVIPDPPVLYYRWGVDDAANLARHREALARLAANATYLGHSSSLVRVALCDEPPPPQWRRAGGDEPVEIMLRVPTAGRLQHLSMAYELSRRHNRRIEPPEALSLGYVRTDRAPRTREPRTLFDDRLIVLRKVTGSRLPLHASLRLTDLVRRALIAIAEAKGGQVPEVICGHRRDGSKSTEPHIAIVPLADVDHHYADGDIKGFALVLPMSLRMDTRRRDELRSVLRAVAGLRELHFSRDDLWTLEETTADDVRLTSLSSARWTRPSRHWVTVTPVVFGRFPKRNVGSRRWMQSDEVEAMVREHCAMVGLTDEEGRAVLPKRVEVMEVSPVLGVAPSPHFPTLSTQGKPLFPQPGPHDARCGRWAPRLPRTGAARLRAHVLLQFTEPVRGPLLLGAGRYLGFGFCMPWRTR